jgi:hypothetical protein
MVYKITILSKFHMYILKQKTQKNPLVKVPILQVLCSIQVVIDKFPTNLRTISQNIIKEKAWLSLWERRNWPNHKVSDDSFHLHGMSQHHATRIAPHRDILAINKPSGLPSWPSDVRIAIRRKSILKNRGTVLIQGQGPTSWL